MTWCMHAYINDYLLIQLRRYEVSSLCIQDNTSLRLLLPWCAAKCAHAKHTEEWCISIRTHTAPARNNKTKWTRSERWINTYINRRTQREGYVSNVTQIFNINNIICTRVYIHTYLHTYKHIYIYIQTYIHINIQSYIYIYIQCMFTFVS